LEVDNFDAGFVTFTIVSASPKYLDSSFFIKNFIFFDWKGPFPESVCGEKCFSNNWVVHPDTRTSNETVPSSKSLQCRYASLFWGLSILLRFWGEQLVRWSGTSPNAASKNSSSCSRCILVGSSLFLWVLYAAGL